jgi:hypothetical protein
VKRVLMGHSLGGACAALEYMANPSDYAAVVLVDPAIIAGVGGPAERDPPNSAVRLEKLQDGTRFTRTLASGEVADPSAAAAAAAAAAPPRRVSSSSSSSSSGASSSDLDELAAAAGNITRSPSSTGGGSGGAGDGSGASLAAAAAAGEVVLYAARGAAAAFEQLARAADPSSTASGSPAARLVMTAVGLVRVFLLLTTTLALSALRPVIVLLLRIAVRSRKFWANTLKQVCVCVRACVCVCVRVVGCLVVWLCGCEVGGACLGWLRVPAVACGRLPRKPLW